MQHENDNFGKGMFIGLIIGAVVGIVLWAWLYAPLERGNKIGHVKVLTGNSEYYLHTHDDSTKAWVRYDFKDDCIKWKK